MVFERLIDEFKNLSLEINELKETINRGKYSDSREVTTVEMELLRKQLKAMQMHAEVLKERITLFMEKLAKGE